MTGRFTDAVVQAWAIVYMIDGWQKAKAESQYRNEILLILL